MNVRKTTSPHLSPIYSAIAETSDRRSVGAERRIAPERRTAALLYSGAPHRVAHPCAYRDVNR